MSLFDRFKKSSKPSIPEAGDGILPIVFGDGSDLEAQLDEDVEVYRETGMTIVPLAVSSVSELREVIESNRPQVLHLLSTFTDRGSLVDGAGDEIHLRELMSLSEEAGVRLFILAAQNDFNHIKDQIADCRIMNLLTILERNRHSATFLRGLLVGLGKDPNFALAYVNLAPQHEIAQKDLPLPGSIAVCPGKKGKDLVLWTQAQP